MMLRILQWIFELGRQHQQVISDASLEDAFNSGYAEGYQDGQRDAGVIEVELDLSDLADEGPPSGVRPKRLMPPPDGKLN
jgi:hypothetical protein